MAVASEQNPHLNNRILATLSAEAISKLAPHLREVLLFPGDTLHNPGEKIEQVYFIRSGIVSLMVVMEDGSTIETVSIGNEGAIGTIEGFGSLFAFTSARVQVAGSASRMPGTIFRQLIEQIPELKDLVNHYHMAVMAHAQQTTACNALHDLTRRLSRILLLSADRCAQDIQLSQDSLAQILGARRPSVTLAAHELRDAGAIVYRRGVIKILDREKLEGSVCECYRTIRHSIDRGFRLALSNQDGRN
jgi:CRP-like cAMP-binding protein